MVDDHDRRDCHISCRWQFVFGRQIDIPRQVIPRGHPNIGFGCECSADDVSPDVRNIPPKRVLDMEPRACRAALRFFEYGVIAEDENVAVTRIFQVDIDPVRGRRRSRFMGESNGYFGRRICRKGQSSKEAGHDVLHYFHYLSRCPCLIGGATIGSATFAAYRINRSFLPVGALYELRHIVTGRRLGVKLIQ